MENGNEILDSRIKAYMRDANAYAPSTPEDAYAIKEIENLITHFYGPKKSPFYPSNIDIDIRDIATTASRVCHFGGHGRWFYSVLQHSILVHDHVSLSNKKAGLMNAASETYVRNILKCIRPKVSDYRRYEALAAAMIANRFGYALPLPKEVVNIKQRLWVDERRCLSPSVSFSPDRSEADAEPLGLQIEPWAIEYTLDRFISMAENMDLR